MTMGLVSEPVLLRDNRAKALGYLSKVDLQFSTVLAEIVRHSFQRIDAHCAPLLLWACAACGGDAAAALPVAASVECFHRFVDLHAELAGVEPQRPDSAERVWGTAQTLNAGDAFHAVALRLLAMHSTHPDRALEAGKIFTRALLRWIDQHSRTAANGRPWIRSAHAAAATLFLGASLEGGAVLAGADRVVVQLFGRAGRSLGMAKQAAQDRADASLTTYYADKAVSLIEGSAVGRAQLHDFKEIAYHLASATPG